MDRRTFLTNIAKVIGAAAASPVLAHSLLPPDAVIIKQEFSGMMAEIEADLEQMWAQFCVRPSCVYVLSQDVWDKCVELTKECEEKDFDLASIGVYRDPLLPKGTTWRIPKYDLYAKELGKNVWSEKVREQGT